MRAADDDEVRLLFDANPRPMFVFDRETLALLIVNDATCALYGWSREELLAMTIRDLRPPDEVPDLEFALGRERRHTKTTFARRSRHRTRSGCVLDVEVEMARITFRDRPACLAVITDLTGTAEAERRFRVLVEHSVEGISAVDEQGQFVYLSPGAERILGVRTGELVGQPAGALMHPDDLARLTIAGPGETVANVFRTRHEDSWRWIEATTTNLCLDPGIRAYVINFRNVTERKTAELMILDGQHRLEYLLSATSAITYSTRASGDFGATFLSANVKNVLGHDASAFVNDPSFFLRHVHPEDRGYVEASLSNLLATGTHSIRYRFRHADGGYRWMQDVVRLVRDDRGLPVELIGSWIDVTDRMVAETALRRSEADFRTLIERLPMATLIHRDGRIVYVNPTAIEHLRYQGPEELVGRSIFDLVHPDDHETVRTQMARNARDGGSGSADARMIRADGTIAVFEAETVTLDFDGKPANVVIGRDITERRELVARMAMADRMLSVGTLAAGVAHEINNPLAYVISNLELLARELPTLVPEARAGSRFDRNEIIAILADAQEGARRVSAIVRDLRALTRPAADVCGPVDVIDVLGSSIRMANNELKHRARVVQSYADDLPRVHANASRLGQVFLNLLLNAAHAIDEGRSGADEVRVRVSKHVDGSRVTVEIEDTGAGIPPEIVGRIFDPFFTTKPVGVGVGLGLAISHQIVQSIGGEISVKSTLGQGTTFRITLQPSEGEPRSEVIAALPAAAPSRILMIDDEAAVGRAVRALLAPEHDVITITRPTAALARIEAGESFDVILCDLMMPEMSGMEFDAQLALCAPEYRDRIVFVTGGAFTEEARAFLAATKRTPIEKPFSEEQLRRAIDSVMR